MSLMQFVLQVSGFILLMLAGFLENDLKGGKLDVETCSKQSGLDAKDHSNTLVVFQCLFTLPLIGFIGFLKSDYKRRRADKGEGKD